MGEEEVGIEEVAAVGRGLVNTNPGQGIEAGDGEFGLGGAGVRC